MGVLARSARGRVVAAFTLVAAVTAAGGVTASTAGAATRPRSALGVVHSVGPAAQNAARAFWTPARMAAATPVPATAVPDRQSAGAAAPPQIPHSHEFAGVPTVGALFFTTGTQAHFCTASVVNSFTANLILTAAHCVYGSTYASNIAFVPKYYRGHQPYGAWPVRTITVAAGWKASHSQTLDFAFLTVAPPAGTHTPIQFVTGGLWLGINRGYAHPIEVIGYNNSGDAPIECATQSFEFKPHQMKFFCHNFQDGTSGGPWILGYHPGSGTGTVFGVIGGFDTGGNYTRSSYSVYFSWPTLRLFLQAEHHQA